MTTNIEETKVEDSVIKDLMKFDEAYYNGSPLIPDDQYDMLRKDAESRFPDHEYFTTAPHQKGTVLEKVDLPYPMGSLNQVYESEALKWAEKYDSSHDEMVVTEKLDGASILLIYEPNAKGKTVLSKAYTRGDGTVGHDVTRHLGKMTSIPKVVNCEYLAVRAEVIMRKSVFNEKYQKQYKNPRNLVAGFLNRKETNLRMIKDIDIVAYEIIDISGVNNVFTKEETVIHLKQMGFSVARHLKLRGYQLKDDKLSEVLEEYRKTGKYDLDGVVITINDYSEFKEMSESDSLNPEHSVKFKVTTDFHIVEVEEVIWKLSKSNFFKPRVRIKPVDLDGATITYATGHNAKFIHDNGIGKGCKVKVTRSGSVIPYIMEVVESVTPDMPPKGTWEWEQNEVEIVSKEEISTQRTLMETVHFFKTLGVEHVQETSIQKLIGTHGWSEKIFDDLVVSIIELWDAEWKTALGENGNKAFLSLHTILSNMKHEVLMGAVPFFGRGFGVRKSKKVLDQISFEDFRNASLEDFQNLEGFDTTCEAIHSGLERFNTLLDRIDDYITFKEKSTTDLSMKGQVIVMTGFRDKELKEQIEDRGGKVTTSVSKNTTMILAKNPKSSSSKIKKARDLDIPVVAISDFVLV